jgi:acetamidase/formamidase
MTSHRLEPAPGTTRDVFSRDHAPVLTVDPGDTVTVGSLNSSGVDMRITQVANETWGVHAALPTGVLSGPGLEA